MTDNIITFDKLSKYNGRLKPHVITDISVVENDNDGNDLQLKFLDNHIKNVTLPAQEASAPVGQYRTVTKIPLYFEIHFKVGEITQEYDDNTMSYINTINSISVLDINPDDVKEMLRVTIGKRQSSIETYSDFKYMNVTDVTETKKYDDYDKVFLVAVDGCLGDMFGDISYSLDVSMKPSFGTIGIRDPLFLSLVNNEFGTSLNVINSQVVGSNVISLRRDSDKPRGNYMVFNAYIDGTFDPNPYANYGTRCIGNDYFQYDGGLNVSSCRFNLSFENAESDYTETEFRKNI